MARENFILIVCSAVFSGIFSTLISMIWERIFEKRQIINEILQVLMAHSYQVHEKESVEALNKINVVFRNYHRLPVLKDSNRV